MKRFEVNKQQQDKSEETGYHDCPKDHPNNRAKPTGSHQNPGPHYWIPQYPNDGYDDCYKDKPVQETKG